MMDAIETWIRSNPVIFGKLISTACLVFGLLLIIGAIRDWDWLYAPDKHYQNNWAMGQISRYMGRGNARVTGAIGGVIFVALGCILVYAAFFK